MYNSCINHPGNQPLIIIRQWQLDFCEGDTATAALLSFFEYWHTIKLAMQEQKKNYEKYNTEKGMPAVAEKGNPLIQFHNTEQLIDGIMHITKTPAKIRESINFLETKGVIKVSKNPSPKYAFDKTRYFLFQPEVINAWLSERYNPPTTPAATPPTVPNIPEPTPTPIPNDTVQHSEPATEPTPAPCNLIFDFEFKNYTEEQKASVYKILTDVPNPQAVLDEVNVSITKNIAKNPMAYLLKLANLAKEGKFIATANLEAKRQQPKPQPAPQSSAQNKQERRPSLENMPKSPTRTLAELKEIAEARSRNTQPQNFTKEEVKANIWYEYLPELEKRFTRQDYKTFIGPIKAIIQEGKILLLCCNKTLLKEIQQHLHTIKAIIPTNLEIIAEIGT